MLDELFYDESMGEWRVRLWRPDGYSRDYCVVFSAPAKEPADRSKLYSCTAKVMGPGTYVTVIGEVV